ncbi:ribonuclease domain-containing protein [Kitasatospora sp. MAP5-34]|uniref:ribonuclease domain-containing protein n=1 Tax=Kitasatospora sp. MAP5-34 TaxID=3035102 RepID=UPI0024732771|nr:ribonuclease domain-containing protein [Kitasatospora sp. MAP5-34]MDH6574846.1 ribonuclease T1 [Kitasatospora sp. MAP5-34]
MTSRNRLIAVVAVVLCAIAAVVAFGLLGGTKSSSTKPSSTKSTSHAAGPATMSAGKPGSTVKPSAPARPSGAGAPAHPGIADVCRSKLPSQARDTLALVDKGGPYPYRTDGIVFENRENRLPKQSTGYYHEFTVVTPGSGDRGTRRVVTGTAGEEYWTGDHYSTFQAIDGHC